MEGNGKEWNKCLLGRSRVKGAGDAARRVISGSSDYLWISNNENINILKYEKECN